MAEQKLPKLTTRVRFPSPAPVIQAGTAVRERSIVITGGSSGIGKALAIGYAGRGTRLGLLGRDQARLAAVAAACRQHGAEVESATIDVCARAEMRAWLEDFDRAGAVDLLIANAGVMTGRPVDGPIEPADASYGLMQINVLGVLNSVHPLLAPMIDRGRGQIAIVSSIAGFIPLPDSPSYSASKAAMINYGLALRHLLHSHGINVSVVCPGYVRTPMMAQETGLQPFALAPEAAAARIRRGLERNRAIIAFPFLFALLTRFGGLLPDRLRRRGMEPHRFTVAERAGDG